MNKPYQTFEQVPWYRRSSACGGLLFIGLFFAPALWFVCLMLITGDIYYNKRDKDGNLQTWSKANKVAAIIIMIFQLFFALRLAFRM